MSGIYLPHMEAVKWVYTKLQSIGLQAVTGRLEGNPLGNIIIVETDYVPTYSKDVVMHSEMPTVTVVIFRSSITECVSVFNQIRPLIAPDLQNGIRSAHIVDREISEYEEQSKMYAMSIEIDVKINLQ